MPANSNYRQFMQEWRGTYAEGLEEEGDVAQLRPLTDAIVAKALADNEQMDPAHICQTNILAPIRIRILEKVVRSILVPKGGDKAALTDLVKIIMVYLIFKRPLDLSRLIMMMMRECTQQGRRALGYGKLITALLRKEQFDFSSYHPIVLESAINEEKVTTMTKGERTRRARAQVQEERARREEEEESQGEEECSGSAEGEETTDFRRTVLELLRGVDEQLRGMRADIQSLGTRVLAVERRMARLEKPNAARAETEAEAETEGWGEAEETGARGETGGEVAVAEGTDVTVVYQEEDEARDDVGIEGTDTTVPAQEEDIGTTLGDA